MYRVGQAERHELCRLPIQRAPFRPPSHCTVLALVRRVQVELPRLGGDDGGTRPVDGPHHDVPGDGYNIDHVVVGRNGVFAIETKSRSKPLKDDGKGERQVEYTGGELFSRTIAVPSLVALPGWYINRSEHSRIPVFNPLKCAAYFRHIGTAELSPDVVKQIAHQLDQRCRDVAPRAYPKKKIALADT